MENEIRWMAVKTNDGRFDGAFVYGVRSTGIYCRPSCSSRLPKRENVEFFSDAANAESRGFRACLRCRPASEAPSPRAAKVIEAAERIESEETISLDSLAAEAGMSSAHFQKLFKELVGVSPKKFAEAKRLERFKKGLRDGSGVTGAMYDAGFGSSSRLYEKAAEKLGMTPKTYARKGKDMKIEYTVADCNLGKILVARTEKGVCAVAFGDEESKLLADLVAEFGNAEISPAGDRLRETVDAVLANLSGSNRSLDLPLDLRATAFQMRVWDELRKVPYGETVSYQQIAERLGNRNAVRAVARACATNRVALVIPCHRVVRSDGELSGYRWGAARKSLILRNEKEYSK
ncbi:MAG: bifunctional DNA-binding transcriptional regulator/O6-methylguanine-DNA methyltransferase Ada [Acidobacteria bacterium]|nr:bifunctional DNA-binding transcriptional regulator/O6-methylguanine-DNA methyltransferase Ada [Acidobacteriota bacterium]